MKRTDDNPDTTHENISMLLPWYTNKSLYGAELALVEQHLQACSLCQQELTNLQQLSVTIQQTNAFSAPTKVGNFSLLKERLSTGAAIEANNIIPLLPASNRRRWYKSASLKMPLATSARLSLAASVLLMILIPYIGQVPGVYKTVSSDKDPIASLSKENDNKISVIFKESTSQQNIERILNSIQGHVINGPNAQSLYTIGFKETVNRQQVIDKLLLLRSNTQVAFAEPAYSLLSATQPKKSD